MAMCLSLYEPTSIIVSFFSMFVIFVQSVVCIGASSHGGISPYRKKNI